LPINKTAKSIILVFTILCVIVLLIFSVELIRQNRNTDAAGGDGGPSLSGDKQTGNGGDAGPDSGTPDASGNGDEATGGNAVNSGEASGSGQSRPPAGSPRPTPKGTRYEEPFTENSTLVFYADNELFSLTEPVTHDGLGIIVFEGTGIAELHINIVAVPKDIKAYAGGYLSMDFGVGQSTVSDEDYIGLSPLMGVKVSGVSQGSTFEAWIHRLSAPDPEDIALAFVINYQNEAQKDLLYDIINSLDIIPAG